MVIPQACYAATPEPRFEFFPKEGKNPKASGDALDRRMERRCCVFVQAYLDAIKAFKPGDVCTVSAGHVYRLAVGDFTPFV